MWDTSVGPSRSLLKVYNFKMLVKSVCKNVSYTAFSALLSVFFFVVQKQHSTGEPDLGVKIFG